MTEDGFIGCIANLGGARVRAWMHGFYGYVWRGGKHLGRLMLKWTKFTLRQVGIWGILVVFLAVSIFCTIKGVIDFHRDKVLSSTINAPLTGNKLAQSPYLRIYVNQKDKVQELTVTSELGKSAAPGASSFDWIHISFSMPPGSASFHWKMALLCVPAGTVVHRDPYLSESVAPAFTTKEPCLSKQATSEIIITGRYEPKITQPAPVTDISEDTSGVASFGVPLAATSSWVATSGSDYIANFPSVESQDACPPVGEPLPSNPVLSLDGGPNPAPEESHIPDCAGIKMLDIRKVLDVAAADTTQVPPAAGPETSLARPGLAWLDVQPNNVLSVQVNSPSQDAMAHLDEVYGAVYWGVAAAAAIALLLEIRDRKGDISRLCRRIGKRRPPTETA
jgi:hypothetical protein